MATSWRGASDLLTHLVPLRSLTVDPQNARVHPERNLSAIRASLRAFGQRKPIVVRSGIVIAGNGLLQVADQEGWDMIAMVQADDLTEDQAKAYAIADNQTSDLSEWSIGPLQAAMRSLPADLRPATGFSAEELSAVVAEAFDKDEKPDIVTIKLTRDQAVIFEGALAKLREQEGDAKMTPGRAIELLSAEFLS